MPGLTMCNYKGENISKYVFLTVIIDINISILFLAVSSINSLQRDSGTCI